MAINYLFFAFEADGAWWNGFNDLWYRFLRTYLERTGDFKLFDVAGRQVATLAERYFEPGTHTLTWDGTDSSGRPVARGVYFAQVKFAQQKERFGREIVVLK